MGGNKPTHIHVLLSSSNPSSPPTRHCECKQSKKSASSSPFPSIHCDQSKPSQQTSSFSLSSPSFSAALAHISTLRKRSWFTERREDQSECCVSLSNLLRKLSDMWKISAADAHTHARPNQNSIKVIEKLRRTTTKARTRESKVWHPLQSSVSSGGVVFQYRKYHPNER